MEEKLEIQDDDLQFISEQVAQGFTSGRLDSEDGTKISWSLELEIWKDE